MGAPLHHEAANADLITDIVAPSSDRCSDLSELARDLASGCVNWREAWSVGASMTSPTPEPAQLTHAEDQELRRLNYLAEIGTLAGVKAERLIELRLRDRRNEVRPPDEYAGDRVDSEIRRKWHRFRRG